MSSSTTSNAQSNRRWLYRCVHEHAHEVRNDIREKFTEIERLRLEGGFGLVNDISPGDWNWVPEAELQEYSVAWIKVKDRSCTLPSDDEIQKMCCSGNVVSPGSTTRNSCEKEVKSSIVVSKHESGHRVPPKPANTSSYVEKTSQPKSSYPSPSNRRPLSRMGANLRTGFIETNDSKPVRDPNPSPSTTEITKKTGVLRKMESTSREHQSVECTQSYQGSASQTNGGIYRQNRDDTRPDIEVVTLDVLDEEPEKEISKKPNAVRWTPRNIVRNMPPGYHQKRRGDRAVNQLTEKITWVGLSAVDHHFTPIPENNRQLEVYKSKNANLLPQNLTLLTYFFKTPIVTYKKPDDYFYKDFVTRYVPIIKIKIQGKPGLDVVYNEKAIVDIGSDYNVAPQLSFSKRMTKDIVIRNFENLEDQTIQLRWRREGKFYGSEYVKIALKPDMVGTEGKLPPLMTKLIVAQSFEMSHLVLGYNFVRLYVPAIDFEQNHLYLISREEDGLIMRFDIEKWVTIDEVIYRLGNPPTVFVKSAATKLKLFEKPHYPNDTRWYPKRNDAIEEIAPPTLTERNDIARFDFCNSFINVNEFKLVPEDERYSYPPIAGLTVG